MAHKIEKQDIVYSTVSPEWHGLAQVRPTLDTETVSDVLFPIVELEEIRGVVDGEAYRLDGYKAIAADLRARGAGITPLGIHSDKYQVISNLAIWESVERAMTFIPHKITTCGTLDNCKRFFITVELGHGFNKFKVGKDDYLAYVNFVTSHDGSLALNGYDSNTRIVCNNTLMWSLNDKGNYSIKLKHHKNADVSLSDMEKFFDNTLSERHALQEKLSRLASMECDFATAQKALVGWTVKRTDSGEKDRLSTRSQNTIEGVLACYRHGQGNLGQTRYDLFNGFTDFYSNGNGAGKDRTQAVTRSLFGSAAETKQAFTRTIVDDEAFSELVEIGDKSLALLN